MRMRVRLVHINSIIRQCTLYVFELNIHFSNETTTTTTTKDNLPISRNNVNTNDQIALGVLHVSGLIRQKQ